MSKFKPGDLVTLDIEEHGWETKPGEVYTGVLIRSRLDEVCETIWEVLEVPRICGEGWYEYEMRLIE